MKNKCSFSEILRLNFWSECILLNALFLGKNSCSVRQNRYALCLCSPFASGLVFWMISQSFLGKTVFPVRQKGVPPLLLPASMLQSPRCLTRICNLDSYDSTLFELERFKKCDCSRKTKLQKYNLLRKCGLLAHTSAAFLKNCCTEKLFSSPAARLLKQCSQKKQLQQKNQTEKIQFASQMWAARPHLGSIFEKLLHRKTFQFACGSSFEAMLSEKTIATGKPNCKM